MTPLFMTLYSKNLFNQVIIFVLMVSALTSLSINTYAEEGTPDSRNITLQLKWKHQFQFAGYYAALSQNYFRDEGLKVAIKPGGPGINAIEEVLEKNAQYGVGGGDIIYDRLQNKPIVILASIFQHSASALVVNKDSGILSPHDLAGKTVNIMTGDKPIIEMAAMLEFEGMSLDKLKLAQNSPGYDLPAKNVADYIYLTNEPFIYKQRNQEVDLIRPMNYGIDFYGDSLFTTEEETREYPDTVDRMRRAIVKGWKYALQNPKEVILQMQKDYELDKSFEHLMFEADITQ